MRSINCRCFKSSAAYISINLAPKRTVFIWRKMPQHRNTVRER